MLASDSPGRDGPRRPRPAWRQRRRRGASRGSLAATPINSSLVRAAVLLLAGPLLLLALTIGRPGPLPASALPPLFDGPSATQLATELARDYPDREPGSTGAADAAAWFKDTLALYGLVPTEDAWDETIPGLGRVRLRNLVTVIPGASADAILFVAHRDDSGVGPGANNNASGTAVLIELARGYGKLGTVVARPTPQHTLIFLSSDGGAYGGYGAERFASTSPFRDRVRAVVSLDGLAGTAAPRIELSGFTSRSPAPALLSTANVRIRDELGRTPARPGWLVQLADLAIPFGYGEQAPFLAREISAIRLSTTPDGGAGAELDTTGRFNTVSFVRLGRAAAAILSSLDGGIELAGGTAGHVYLGSRFVRGWTIELLLIVAIIPFLVGTVDLLARARRQGLPLAGAFRALRIRVGLWLWVGLVVGAGAVAGVFPTGSAIPPPPDSPAVTNRPVTGLAVLGVLAALGWWRSRRSLAPAVPAAEAEVVAGYAAAFLALAVVSVATAVISPYGLVFVVPSLYAWLWLPQVERRPGWVRDILYGLGLTGPALALVVVGGQLGLGLNTPLYVVSLMTLGFIPWPTVLVLIAWAAVAAQLGALAAGRYRPVARRARREHVI